MMATCILFYGTSILDDTSEESVWWPLVGIVVHKVHVSDKCLNVPLGLCMATHNITGHQSHFHLHLLSTGNILSYHVRHHKEVIYLL